MTSLDAAARLPSRSSEKAGPLGAAEAHVSLSLLLGIGVVCVVDLAIIGGLLTPIKQALGLTDEQFARNSVVFTLAGIFAAPIFSTLGNRFGRKPVLLGGILVWSVATVGSGMAGGLVGLLMWRGVVGFGEGAYNAIAPSWLADLYGPRWRNFVFALYMLRNKVGYSIAIGLGGAIAAAYGWQWAFFMAGLPGLLFALGLLFVREPEMGGRDRTAGAARSVSHADWLALVRYPGFLLHLLAWPIFNISTVGQIWIPAYFTRTFQLTNLQATGYVSLVLLYTLPSGLVGGFVSSLFLRNVRGGFPLFLAGTSFLAAASYAIAYTTADVGVAKVWVAVAIAAFGFSAGTLTTLIVETVPAQLRTNATAVTAMVSGGVSGIVGPMLIGMLSDRFGLVHAIMVLPVSIGIAGVLWAVLGVGQATGLITIVPGNTTTGPAIAAAAEPQP